MTTLIRRAPYQEMLTLRNAVNRMFDESFAPAARSAFAPALNLSETPEAYHIELVVPGMKAEDLNITFENGVLTLSGEIKQESESGERTYHRVERRYGRFSRTVTLPATVRGDAIAARLEHGLLQLTLPKAEEVKPRKITVNVAS